MRNKCYQIAGRAARFRTGQRCSQLVSVADQAEGGGGGVWGSEPLCNGIAQSLWPPTGYALAHSSPNLTWVAMVTR